MSESSTTRSLLSSWPETLEEYFQRLDPNWPTKCFLICNRAVIGIPPNVQGRRLSEVRGDESHGDPMNIVDLACQPKSTREQATNLLVEGFDESLRWPDRDSAREEAARVLREGCRSEMRALRSVTIVTVGRCW